MSDVLRDSGGNFLGFADRDCGEHRTVGEHRAWCFDCHEWCSATSPCVRCEIAPLRKVLREAAEDMKDGPENGHQFHFSVGVQASSSVTGIPGYRDAPEVGSDRFTLTVRAWSLREACEAAAKVPIEAWSWSASADPDEAPSGTDPTP